MPLSGQRAFKDGGDHERVKDDGLSQRSSIIARDLTARERYYAVTHFEPGVRTLLWELVYWAAAVERWYREGLPRSPWSPPVGQRPGDGVYGDGGTLYPPPPTVRYRDLDIHNFLGFDNGCVQIPLNWRCYPPFETVVLEEDDETRLVRSRDGLTLRERKDGGSVPQFVGWLVRDRADWEQVKEERFRLDQVDERFPGAWSELIATYRNRDFPFGQLMDGFFSAPRELLGVENQLVMYYDDPELMKAITSHLTELWLAMLEKVVAEIDLDYVSIWEDMCFKNGPLISPRMFEEFCAPHYHRVTGFLKSRGVDVIWVDTDGDLRPLIPQFIEAGVTGSSPLEAQAGASVVEVRKKHPRFLMMGGINKLKLARGRGAIDAELDAKLPYVLSTGGYIPTCDHMVPPEVSWEDFCYYRERVREHVCTYQLEAGRRRK